MAVPGMLGGAGGEVRGDAAGRGRADVAGVPGVGGAGAGARRDRGGGAGGGGVGDHGGGGVAEIEAGGLDGLPPGRSRRPGGGRKKAEDAQPGLGEALKELLEAATRGDPVAEITWCSLSLRELERQLAARGFGCGKDAIAGCCARTATACRGCPGFWRGTTGLGRPVPAHQCRDRGIRGGGGSGGQRGCEEEGAAGPLSPGRPHVAARGHPGAGPRPRLP